MKYEDFTLSETTTAISTTVPITAGNGTATALSYSFTSTTKAGMYNALANTNSISVGGVGITAHDHERMRIGSTTVWRRHTSDGRSYAIERTLRSCGVFYNQLSDTTGNNNTFTPIVFSPLNSATELLSIYSDSVRSANPFRNFNIHITSGANIATVRNTATANTTITLSSSTGTLALTSQVPASEYFIRETTTAQSINNSSTIELTLNGRTTSGHVGW